MTILELYGLVKLLVKYRALFALSHAKRDLIDEMVLDILERLQPLVMDSPKEEGLPF